MLSTAAALKQKLSVVLAGGVTQAAIAQACEVSKQAVQGWKNTGRIDKRHLPALAEVSGKPLTWWLDYSQHEGTSVDAKHSASKHEVKDVVRHYHVDRWPFTSITRDEYALLNSEQRTLVEGFIRGLLAETTRNKRKTTTHAA